MTGLDHLKSSRSTISSMLQHPLPPPFSRKLSSDRPLLLTMRAHFTLLAISLAWPARVIGGYGIDSSCADRAFIQASADAAIDMAAKADAAIGEPDGRNRDPNVQRLLKLLFGNAAENTDRINRIKRVFQGVASMSGDEGFVEPSDDETATSKVVSTIALLNGVRC